MKKRTYKREVNILIFLQCIEISIVQTTRLVVSKAKGIHTQQRHILTGRRSRVQ